MCIFRSVYLSFSFRSIKCPTFFGSNFLPHDIQGHLQNYEFLVPAANSEDGPRTYKIVRASTGTMIFCITYTVAAIELMNNPAFNCTIFHYSSKENIKD